MRKFLKFFISFLVFICIAYCAVVFIEIPGISMLRNIWIETAMTTGEHQWLATAFFPEYLIEEVMSKKVEDNGEVGITNIESTENVGFDSPAWELNFSFTDNKEEAIEENVLIIESEPVLTPELVEEEIETKNETPFTDIDEFGNKVIVNDKEENIKIVEIKTATYTALLTFIDDPSRIFIQNTPNKGIRGELILNYLKNNDAIIGINANGFVDYEGKGLGGEIIGYSVSSGEIWGSGDFSRYTTLGFDSSGRLIVGKIDNPEDYDLQHAAQFGPALILNGKILVEGSAGWGIQPRTVVGQRSDGVVMFLVVDGRRPGHSIGITMGDAAALLYQYGAVNAAACDGGSSSVLAYNGEIINIPSTPMVTGRYLPNVWLVKSLKN